MRLTSCAIILAVLFPGTAFADELLYAFNTGGNIGAWDSHGNYFEVDQEYEPGGGGYDYGFPTLPAYVPNISPWTTDDFELHYWQRHYLNGYHFDLPPGDYVVRLYWLDGRIHGPRLRLMDVSLEGNLVLDDLDVVGEVGFMGAYERSFLVNVTDGTLDVDIDSVRSATMLSAIAVWSLDDQGDAPHTPGNFRLESSYGMNIIRWDTDWQASIDETEILRADSQSGPYEVVGSTAYHRRYWLDKDAVPGSNYYYKIRCTDVWGRASLESIVLSTQTMAWQDIGLPVCHINMAQADFDSLNSNVFANDFYDVGWAIDDNPFKPGDGRYRGGLARYFPKKSWKVKPGILDAFEDLDVFTLITSPDDNYVIRNHVTMEAFDLLPNVWNSDIYWTGLWVNGEYAGVSDLTEAVDSEFLAKRGEDLDALGNLYKAYGNMDIQPGYEHYVTHYEFKAGPGSDWADIIGFIEDLHYFDEYDRGAFLAETVDLTNFFDYYSMMIYTRQYDHVVRNYYLYHSPVDGLWSLMPWDMTLSFWPDPLELDFATTDSPHFWDGSYNVLFDKILNVPRLRWEYVTRLEYLHGSVLNGPTMVPIAQATYDEIALEGLVDPYRPFFATGDYFDIARDYISYRINQRDTQFATMIPDFKDEITTICINEMQAYPASSEAPWIELYNYGEEPTSTLGFKIEADSTINVPVYILASGESMAFVIDEGGVPGSVINPLGGTLKLKNGSNAMLDALRYGEAAEGQSEGRHPDGWITWSNLFPSYGVSNGHIAAPFIRSVDLQPEQPTMADTLKFEVRFANHSRPYEANINFAFSDSSWTLALVPTGTDSILWTVQQDPLLEGGNLYWHVEAVDELGLRVTHPADAPTYNHKVLILGGVYAIFLNEFMADNATTYPDEVNEYEDWVEIYNAGAEDFDLAGFTLSDDEDWAARWTFPEDPASIVPAGGYILVYADEDISQGPLHANFKLSRFGEEIGLYQPDATPVDFVEYGPQHEDESYGRISDGDPRWDIQIEPTPLGANLGGISTDAPDAPAPFRLSAYPNPFNPRVTLRFALPEATRTRLEVYDLQGRRTATLMDESLDAGSHEVVWSGVDDRGNDCATGVYLAHVRAGEYRDRFKLLLLK